MVLGQLSADPDDAAPALAANRLARLLRPFVGIAVARGVPDAAVTRLREALEKVANDAAFTDKALNTATAITYLPAEEFGAVWERDWNAFEPMLRK